MNNNKIEQIVHAYKLGRADQIAGAAESLARKTEQIENLKKERETLIKRLDEMTTNQWEMVKKALEKAVPEVEWTNEEIRKHCL